MIFQCTLAVSVNLRWRFSQEGESDWLQATQQLSRSGSGIHPWCDQQWLKKEGDHLLAVEDEAQEARRECWTWQQADQYVLCSRVSRHPWKKTALKARASDAQSNATTTGIFIVSILKVEFLHPEIDPHRCCHFIYNRSAAILQWERMAFPINSTGAIGYPYWGQGGGG